jgi:hypothetical protein
MKKPIFFSFQPILIAFFVITFTSTTLSAPAPQTPGSTVSLDLQDEAKAALSSGASSLSSASLIAALAALGGGDDGDSGSSFGRANLDSSSASDISSPADLSRDGINQI